MQLLRHLAAVLIAVLLSGIVIFYFNKKNEKPPIASTIFSPKYNSNYGEGNTILQGIYSALNTGNRIVVFGSSELTQLTDTAIPYHFFNDKLHIPLVALGQAGNQSFSISCQLAAMNHSLENSKTVIILSPSWLNGDYANGTSLTSFFEYISEAELYKIFYNKNVPDEFKNCIAAYIHKHYTEIGFASPLIDLWNMKAVISTNIDTKTRYSLQLLCLKGQCEWNKQILNSFQLNLIDSVSNNPLKNEGQQPNWINLQQLGFKNENDKCSNLYAINDEYFAKYCKDNLPRETADVPTPNQEMADIKMLIELCKYYKMKPLFIMQPLNAIAYTNLNKLSPAIHEIELTIKQNGFTVFNMWTDKKENYTKGTLTDVMHLGEYGWYQVDEAMYNYFVKK